MNTSDIEKIDLEKVDWRGSREFFESLGEALDRLDDKDESYDFTWVGKRKAIIEAGAPTNKTFRPDVEASKNWNATENLFIEGDNLDALKLLQESYLGNVKTIYIDPPYNTGKDFVYRDDFKATIEDHDEATSYKDAEGNIQYGRKNEKTNGRYHSDWLSMIYPRLKLARNLLTNDGVIFISIDDNEQPNLRKVCDEIFSESNLLGQMVWHARGRSKTPLSIDHEYILVYAKDISNIVPQFDSRGLNPTWYGEPIERKYSNPDGDTRGDWRDAQHTVTKKKAHYTYSINKQTGELRTDVFNDSSWYGHQTWMYAPETIRRLFADNRLFFIQNGDRLALKVKKFKTEEEAVTSLGGLVQRSEISSRHGSEEVDKLVGPSIFDYPKPTALLRRLLRASTKKDDIILDFFSGSGTTAHAVMQLNAEDGGSRKYIVVQLPEETSKKSEAYKVGYKTIPEISRERIRRAGEKIADMYPNVKIDYGFRTLKIADTNYKEVYKAAGQYEQSALLDAVDNIKDDRSDLDLLYGVLTQSALELNRPIEAIEIAGVTAYKYNYSGEISGLIACFAKNIPEEVIKEIAKLKPLTTVFRESSFADSQAKVNLTEHFRILSPETKVKVI